MRNRSTLIPLVFLLCFAFACQKRGHEAIRKPGANREADVASIKALFDEWTRLYNAGDFEKLVSDFYSEDAILMSPNEASRIGKEAILLSYVKARALEDEHVDSSVVEDVRVSGDLAVARGTDSGTTTRKNGGKPVTYNLKWLIVLERQPDGAWKWLYEIWNDDPLPENQINGGGTN